MSERMEDNLDMPLWKVLRKMQYRINHQTTYMGIPIAKCLLDLWVYQELIVEHKPDVIIEIGNGAGGSTKWLANLCRASLPWTRIIGIDVDHNQLHPSVVADSQIHWLTGDASKMFPRVRVLLNPDDRIMVIEDSSHTYVNTLNILRTYSPLLQVGDWFIVEDGIIGHGLRGRRSGKQGPYEAVETFLRETPAFEADRSRESWLITWNPKGYLRRVR